MESTTLNECYDSEEDVFWGPVTAKEIKKILTRKVDVVNKRNTIATMTDLMNPGEHEDSLDDISISTDETNDSILDQDNNSHSDAQESNVDCYEPQPQDCAQNDKSTYAEIHTERSFKDESVLHEKSQSNYFEAGESFNEVICLSSDDSMNETKDRDDSIREFTNETIDFQDQRAAGNCLIVGETPIKKEPVFYNNAESSILEISSDSEEEGSFNTSEMEETFEIISSNSHRDNSHSDACENDSDCYETQENISQNETPLLNPCEQVDIKPVISDISQMSIKSTYYTPREMTQSENMETFISKATEILNISQTTETDDRKDTGIKEGMSKNAFATCGRSNEKRSLDNESFITAVSSYKTEWELTKSNVRDSPSDLKDGSPNDTADSLQNYESLDTSKAESRPDKGGKSSLGSVTSYNTAFDQTRKDELDGSGIESISGSDTQSDESLGNALENIIENRFTDKVDKSETLIDFERNERLCNGNVSVNVIESPFRRKLQLSKSSDLEDSPSEIVNESLGILSLSTKNVEHTLFLNETRSLTPIKGKKCSPSFNLREGIAGRRHDLSNLMEETEDYCEDYEAADDEIQKPNVECYQEDQDVYHESKEDLYDEVKYEDKVVDCGNGNLQEHNVSTESENEFEFNDTLEEMEMALKYGLNYSMPKQGSENSFKRDNLNSNHGDSFETKYKDPVAISTSNQYEEECYFSNESVDSIADKAESKYGFNTQSSNLKYASNDAISSLHYDNKKSDGKSDYWKTHSGLPVKSQSARKPDKPKCNTRLPVSKFSHIVSPISVYCNKPAGLSEFKKPPTPKPPPHPTPFNRFNKNHFGFGKIQSPVSHYIKNTPTVPLLQSNKTTTTGANKQLFPKTLSGAVAKRAKENVLDLPPVVYKPAPRKMVSTEKELKIPHNIERMIPAKGNIVKHRGRLVKNVNDREMVERELLNDDLTIAHDSMDSSVVSSSDISILTSRKAFIK